MLMMDGGQSVIDIAYETGLELTTVQRYLNRFFEAGLIERSPTPWT
jgi:predicted transcriptional regulator